MLTIEEALKRLNESQSQEISNSYKSLSDKYGIDLEKLVYGPDGFMATKYPNDFPDFKGDVIYSEKYWNEFEQWLKDEKGIELPHDDEPSFEELLGEDVNGVSLQDEKARFEKFIKDKGLDKLGKAEVIEKDGQFHYYLTIEDSVKGRDIEDYVDVDLEDVEGDWVEPDFDEGFLIEVIIDHQIDDVYGSLDEDTDEFICEERPVETDYENAITVEDYYYSPATYWSPAESDYELGGDFYYTITYEFKPREE